MRQLHKKTQIEVEKLLAETAHTLSLDDIPDILELDDLAHLVTGSTGEFANIYRWPVKVGRLLFRPLTLGKIAWYNTRAKEWFEEEDETLVCVLGFLLSVENSEEFIWSLSSPDEAKSAIEDWSKLVDVTPEEISSAIHAMVDCGSSGDGSVSGQAMDDGPLVALLCREYGNTPGHWLYTESITTIRALMSDYTRRMNDEIRKHNETARGKSKVPPIKSPSMDATLNFRKKLLVLKEKWC